MWLAFVSSVVLHDFIHASLTALTVEELSKVVAQFLVARFDFKQVPCLSVYGMVEMLFHVCKHRAVRAGHSLSLHVVHCMVFGEKNQALDQEC